MAKTISNKDRKQLEENGFRTAKISRKVRRERDLARRVKPSKALETA